MKRLLALSLCLTGCVSDLAVGMSNRPIAEEDAGLDAEVPRLDAGFPDFDFDSGPPVYFDADASFRVDAGAPVEGYPQRCDPNDCIVFVVPIDYCGDAGEQACARMNPGDDCAVICL